MSTRDPYAVLGISPQATDAEVKAAYREMARKYHPDNYTDNPLSDLAQEKMQEINEAYDTIVRMRQNGGGGYSGQDTRSRYIDIRNMIRANRILDAEMLLDGVPAATRDAEWFFLKGSVLYKKGWLEDATAHYNTQTVNTAQRSTICRPIDARVVIIPADRRVSDAVAVIFVQGFYARIAAVNVWVAI